MPSTTHRTKPIKMIHKRGEWGKSKIIFSNRRVKGSKKMLACASLFALHNIFPKARVSNS